MRWRRGALVAACCALGAALATGGCTRVVAGTGHPADGTPAHGPTALADLMIAPARFPRDYPAVRLDPISAVQAVRDIDGVADGAVVTPPQCTPPPPGRAPVDVVAAQGVNAAATSSLTLTLTRSGTPLDGRRDQLRGCPVFTATADGGVTTVLVRSLPAPPVDADAAYAVEQTVKTPEGEAFHALILAAQIADVRITAVWATSDDAATADTRAVDALFTDAVLTVRRGG